MTIAARAVVINALGAGTLAPIAAGQVVLAPTLVSDQIVLPYSVTSIDLNADGLLDVLVCATDIAWYRNTGGSPSGYVRHTIASGILANAPAASADLDGDGDVDVVSPSWSGIQWYESTGGNTPTFTARVLTSDAATRMTLADFNGDGAVDAMASTPSDTIVLYLNQGGTPPTFSPGASIVTQAVGAKAIVAGDIDGDGDVDAVGAFDHSGAGDAIVWLENDGLDPPSFIVHAISPTVIPAGELAVADVDADGSLDVVAVADLGGSISELFWFRNSGAPAPTFQTQSMSSIPEGPTPGSICAVDLDGDGDLDVCAATEFSNRIDWYESTGAPDFFFRQRLIAATLTAPASVSAGDHDADGDQDLCVVSQDSGGGALFVFDQLRVRNQTASTWHTLLAAASRSAQSGDVLLAHPEHFREEFCQVLDFAGKGLEIVSRGSISRSGSTTTVLPSGASLLADTGAGVVIEGELVLPPASASAIGGDGGIALAGRVDMGSNCALLLLGPAELKGAAVFAARTIDTSGESSHVFVPVDIDGDGDLDIAGAGVDAVFKWYENSGTLPTSIWGVNPTSFLMNPLATIDPADLDDDGDIDIVGVSATAQGTIVWLQSDGGDPPAFIERTVFADASMFDRVVCVDLDADGDLDVCASGFGGNGLIAWYENDGAAVPAFTRRVLATNLLFCSGLSAADVDADGDTDIVISNADTDSIEWFRSNGAAPPAFTRTVIATDVLGASGVLAIDLDLDGDIDIVCAAPKEDSIKWLENDGAPSPTFVPGVLSTEAPQASAVRAADVDGDGDIDLLSASAKTVSISGTAPEFPFAWLENDGSLPPRFHRHVLPVGYPLGFGSLDLIPADLNSDGSIDAVAGPSAIVWFENLRASTLGLKDNSDLSGASSIAIVNRRVSLKGSSALGALSGISIDVHSVVRGSGVISAPAIGSAGTLEPRTLDLLFNADFEAPPVLGPGQSDVDPGGSKWITTSPAGNDYANSISGIDGWSVALDGGPTGVHTDAGISRQHPNQSQRAAFINRWETAFHQTAGVVEQAADYQADLDVGAFDSGKGGRLRIIAGSIDGYGNLTPGSTVLAEKTFATPGWSGPPAMQSISNDGWTSVTLSFTSPTSGPAIGAPLVFAFQLDGGSAGPLEFDNAALSTSSAIGGTLLIDGDYAQIFDDGLVGLRAGSLVIALGDGTSPAKLEVNGEATLAGALHATGASGLAPTIGTTFEILSAAVLTPGSRFATALLPSIGNDRFLSVVYDEGSLRALASVSLQVNPLTGDVELDPQTGADSGASGVPKGATLADIDGDGDPDLLIALPDATNPATANGSVVILYNADDGNPGNGWEGFGQTLQITTGVGVNPSSVAVGRMDANSQPDIVVANRGTPGNAADDTVSVLLVSNPSAAAFATSATFSVVMGDEPADVIIADLDGDGFLDIATANAGSDSISVGWNAGAGTGPGWVPPISIPLDLPDDEETPVSIRPGDTNAGTFTFLATANSGTNTIGVFQVNPNRSIAALPSLPAGNAPVELVIADFNLDGEDDIASVNRNGSSVTITLGSTGASPTLAMGLPSMLPIPTTSSKPRSIAAGDFDADANGDIDIAVLADGVVKILRNDLFNGQLAFTPIPDQPAGATPLLVRSADLNGDGRDDVVTIAQSTGALALAAADGGRARTGSAPVQTLLAVAAPTPCAGDVNGDDVTNAADFVVLAGNFGSSVTPNTNGDLNGDGLVNAADFVILAGDFGCGS